MKVFFEECKKEGGGGGGEGGGGGGGGHIVRLPPKALVIRDEKVSPFVKFEIILPFLCFLLDTITNKH